MTIKIDGTYKAKVRIFGRTLWGKTSHIHVVKDLPGANGEADIPIGPFRLIMVYGQTSVSVGVRLPFGNVKDLIRMDAKTRKPQPFKVELDKANQIEGTVEVTE